MEEAYARYLFPLRWPAIAFVHKADVNMSKVLVAEEPRLAEYILGRMALEEIQDIAVTREKRIPPMSYTTVSNLIPRYCSIVRCLPRWICFLSSSSAPSASFSIILASIVS